MARILATVLLLMFPVITRAGPHRWYKDWRNWAVVAGSLATSVYASHEIHDCRARNDLIRCPDGGYGPFKAREELRGGISLGAAVLTIYGREHWPNGWKNELINDSPAALWSSWNLAVGLADQTTPTFPRNPEYQKPAPWSSQMGISYRHASSYPRLNLSTLK